MYSRNLSTVPEFLIENSKPKFGSYVGTPKSLSISGVKFPYGIIPLPKFITNMRIRGNFSFIFETKDYLGTIDIIGVMFAGFYEINAFSKADGARLSYRGITGIHRHLIPKNMEKALFSTRRRARYIRFAWDKEKNRFSLVFKMKGDECRPNFYGNFISSYTDKDATFTTVLPAPTLRRCYVSHQRVFDAKCGLSVQKGKFEKKMPFFISEKAKCFLVSTRAYFRFRVISSFVSSVGSVKDHSVVFRMSNISCLQQNSDENNENTFFYDGKLTVLPSVVITHPFGMNKKWIIQDTEGMVDLVFYPISARQKILSVIFLHAQYNIIYGTFEGTIVTQDGTQVNLHEFPGIVKNLRSRL